MSDMTKMSLGLVETRGLLAAVSAADAAVKSASVVVSSAELSQNGNTTISIVGELSSVQAAVEAAVYAVERVGRLISSKVIPRPDEVLWKIVGRQKFISAYGKAYTGPALRWDTTPKEKPLRKIPAKQKPVPVMVSRPEPIAPERTVVTTPTATKKTSQPTQSTETKPVTVVSAPPKPTSVSLAELEKLAVVKLRHYARTVADLPLKGRQISMANKSQLLEAIASTQKQ